MTPNYPKPLNFRHFVSSFVYSYCANFETSNLVGRSIVASERSGLFAAASAIVSCGDGSRQKVFIVQLMPFSEKSVE